MPVYELHPDLAATHIARALWRRFMRAAAVLIATVLVSTIGFTVLDDPARPLRSRLFDGLWETLNLVSTVGSLDRLGTAGRAWAMLVIIFGLGAVLYGFGAMQALVVGGSVAELYMRRRMERRISTLSRHIVLCGYGHVGRAAARVISAAGVNVVVIDTDRDAVHRADEDGYISMLGDATDEDALRSVHLDRASGLVAALPVDSANVYLVLVAREVSPTIRIVARAERAESRKRLLRAGADRAIVPGEIAAQQLSHLILKPKVSEFIAAATGQGEYDFAEIEVRDVPHLAGRTLRDLSLPTVAETIVISIINDQGVQRFNPPGDTMISAADTLIVVCRQGGLERIAAMD